MKISKFQHACLVIEEGKTVIVVDPGNLSSDFIMPHKVDAIVITHEHADHFDESLVNQILTKNPKAEVIAHQSISGRFTNYSAVAAKPGESHVVGDISLRFFGGQHAQIAEGIQVPANIAVLFNERLFYPGDSFATPEGVDVQELALPVAAPWLKISEPMAYLGAIKPSFAFPTHDQILSAEGKEIADRMIGAVASGIGATYRRLDGLKIEL